MEYIVGMRLSKDRLSEVQREHLISQFTDVLGKLNGNQARMFYEELFGYEEKEIFAKRLAIVLMLNEGRSCYSIAQRLKVSETTVAKLFERYERKEFSNIIESLTKSKKNYTDLLILIDSILTVGGIMPRRNYIIKAKRKR
ncbi:MAG: helix-turn-helix domain-containing protein [Candidatus Paceibacteria bacterium]